MEGDLQNVSLFHQKSPRRSSRISQKKRIIYFMGYLVADPGAAKLAKPSWNGSLFNLGLKYQILYNPWKIFIVKNA
jgi:hypothetical protein